MSRYFKQTREDNEENILCLVDSFLGRLKPKDFAVCNNKGKLIFLPSSDQTIVILDVIKKRIAKQLARLYNVEEVLK